MAGSRSAAAKLDSGLGAPRRADGPRPGPARPGPPRLLAPIADRIAHELAEPAFRRDPEFIRSQLPLTAAYAGWFSPEVRGLDNLPVTGPALLVGNHSCLFWMPEVWVTALAIIRRRGVEQAAYGLVYDLLLGAPGIGPYLRRAGALPADPRLARQALAAGAAVLVYPGGDHEACRSWTERNRLDFGGRRGFVRLALAAGVPVVPVVTHGGHHAVVVLNRGDRLARLIGLPALRIGVFPIVLGPFGVGTILTPPPPMPAAVTVEFLPALDWTGRAPDDGAAVDACYREITAAMQATMDRLSAERPHPVARGWWRLLRRGMRPAPIAGLEP